MLRLKILTQRLTQRTNVTIPALKPFQMWASLSGMLAVEDSKMNGDLVLRIPGLADDIRSAPF